MKITKIFNNNSVSAINDKSQDIIITGSGVGFQKKIGDIIDKKRIERVYVLQNMEREKFVSSLRQVPTLYFEITEAIITKASKVLDVDFDGSIFISISDHITFAIKRKKEGIFLPNIILNETKILYKEEYEIGLWALKYIEEKTGVCLEEDEAGYIALHLVNFSLNRKAKSATKTAALTKEVLNIVEKTMKIELKTDSIAHARMCTHLKYLAEKIFNNGEKDLTDTTADFRDVLKDDLHLTLCINRIVKLIDERYGYHLSPDDQTYLCIHIKRNLK